jgi:hypothetical protein
VDLASIESGLLPLARLVTADAREMSYSVTADGSIAVARFAALDREAVREQRVLANDAKVSYFADIEKQNTPGKIGVKFRVQVCAPGGEAVLAGGLAVVEWLHVAEDTHTHTHTPHTYTHTHTQHTHTHTTRLHTLTHTPHASRRCPRPRTTRCRWMCTRPRSTSAT